ncbi:BnaA07g05010D [Brassica napus]|uniref:BnaA07g05010D protein n=1 Tax=Brassica napus TaxID=3708 RepID=A0A078GR63_BRANA|nr:BnaA07g05010D [Brassica napus]
MKRKEREEERLCRSRSKIGPIAVDLKTARVTRLPARSTHQEALPQRKKEADGNETSPSSKFDSLPFDLKMAIVSRMGAKSLMKFRCVSKIWSSIIRSRGFIDSFFSMSSKQSRFIVIKLHSSTRFVGYDPIEGQHKALFVESRVSRSSVHHHLDHKVLTLGGGSCQEWRLIEGTPGPYRPISVGVCVNGVIYYGARNSPHFRNPVMVCFDVRTEKLSFIQAHETLLRFDLWILEDPVKHEWSKQHCVFPSSVWDSVWGFEMSFPGTNKDGEIIMAPTSLLLGIGDNKEFRRSYGFLKQRDCFVRIAPQHVHSIASL